MSLRVAKSAHAANINCDVFDRCPLRAVLASLTHAHGTIDNLRGTLGLLLYSSFLTNNEVSPKFGAIGINGKQLHALECGLLGLTLLAPTMLTTRGWLCTPAHRLARLAERFNVAYLPTRH